MARIRQLKPEFWSSPSTAQASAVARLAFMGMWNWADDSGHGTLNLKELEGFIFPNDDVEELSGGKCRNFRHCVADVCGSFGVVLYEVDGRTYYEIPTWQNHQRNERLAKGKFPLPEEGKILDSSRFLGVQASESRKSAEVPTQDHGSSGAVSGYQGVMVSEDQGVMVSEPKPPKPLSSKLDEFLDWYIDYPRKESRGTAEKAYEKARKIATQEQLIEGVIRYRDDPNREPSFTKLPATWLNGKCWEDGPLPERVTQNKPSGSQMRLQAGFELMQQTIDEQTGLLQIERN